MNTPTTEEIEAVLDLLLDRLTKEFTNSLIAVERRRYYNGETTWTAYGRCESKDAATPHEAVKVLIGNRLGRKARRKTELEAELAKLNAELAALGPEKEGQA
jgi:hypothetical protein